MCNQSTWSNLWHCIRRTYLTIKNHQRKFYKILTSWRIQDTKTKLDDKKQYFYIPVTALVTHEYKKPKRWHANMYMISQKNYNHLFATKHMWKAEKIKKITYPRKGTCVCKHLFITCVAVFSKIEYTLCTVCPCLEGPYYMAVLFSFRFWEEQRSSESDFSLNKSVVVVCRKNHMYIFEALLIHEEKLHGWRNKEYRINPNKYHSSNKCPCHFSVKVMFY